jgi:tetratricopeptide (TPR) repeat protein
MLKRTIAVAVMAVALACAALADSYSEGRAAYERGDYARAARLFEAAVRERDDAPSHYAFGLATLKLRRYAEAARALEAAQQKDPSLKFARNAQFFQQRLAEARAGAARGGANQNNAGRGSMRFNRDEHLDQVAADMASGKAVMDYTGALTPADRAALEQAVNDARGRGFNLRFYLIQPNRAMLTREFMVEVKKYLNLTNDDIIVVASREGLYVTGKTGGSELDREEINRAVHQAVAASKQPPSGRTQFGVGMEEAGRLLVGEARSDRTTRRGVFGGLGVIGLGLLAAPVLFVIGRRKMKQQSFKNKLNDAINLLMNDINDRLGKEFDVNARFVNWQTEYEEIKKENNWKDHTRLDRLIVAMQDAVRQPERYFDYKPGVKEIKEAAAKLGAPVKPERSSDDVFDYFDGRPLKKEEAVVVSLRDRDGQEVRVLTSREHAEQMGRGEAPKVLTREVGGRQVHWSNDPTYDPYRDYRPYYGGPNWVDLWLLSQLFSPHSHYGYGIFPYYHPDYYYSPPHVDRPVTDFPGYGNWDGSSIDFGSTPGFEERGARQDQFLQDEASGGVDFAWGGDAGGGSSGGSESSWGSGGGSDWGGSGGGSGWDSGGGGSSWDSGGGGSDWGGSSDFGSSDSGSGSSDN